MDEKNMLTRFILNKLELSRSLPLDNYWKGNAMKAAEIIVRMANERTLTTESIKECLNNYGISYIKVEKLDKTPIDAYSTFSGDMLVITVTYHSFFALWVRFLAQ